MKHEPTRLTFDQSTQKADSFPTTRKKRMAPNKKYNFAIFTALSNPGLV
jgi:hypothetical protein